MKIVGVTGGIGSGKTTVCKIFELLGVPVYYADVQARLLTNSSPKILNDIRFYFGDDVFDERTLNRQRLGNKVFNDREQLNILNNIIHPVVAQHFENWVRKYQNKVYILKESAILFESGANKNTHSVITVVAPIETRINRIRKRDGLSESQILDRINNQWSDEQRIELAQFVVTCNDIDLVLPQVLKIHHQLLKLNGI